MANTNFENPRWRHMTQLTLFYNVLLAQQTYAFEYSDISKDSDITIFFVAYYMDIHFIYQVATPMTQLSAGKNKFTDVL